MSATFLQLYRELENQSTRTRPNDITYLREREDVLQSLGFDVGRPFPKRVEHPKHHGKLSRVRALKDVDKWSTNEKMLKENKVRHEVNDVVREQKKLTNVTDRMKVFIDRKESPPTELFDELFCQRKDFSKRLSPQKPISDDIVEKKLAWPRNSTTITTKSQKQWSKEEINRMNQMFRDLARPARGSHIGLWRLYFETFAKRFQPFFPSRTEAEIIEKVHELLQSRRIKEPGEEMYWKALQEGEGKG